jgi:hypothetical protein
VTVGRSGIHSGTTPPSPAHVGQRWFNTATAVTYQYTRDAAGTRFWLDVSSGGIGTSAERGVDFVGDVDPAADTNGSGLAVGSVYYNRELNRHFVCTDATNDANVWSGRFAAVGGTITTYSGYKVHTFLSSGTFIVEDAISCDILMVAGGGAGGSMGFAGSHGGGGGGAGGFVYYSQKSLTAASYAITVGIGGAAAYNAGNNGGSTTFTGLTSAVGGGRGGGVGSATNQTGATGGSGGGGGNDSGGAGTHTSNQGYAGGAATYGTNQLAGAGGGASQTAQAAGVGGAGRTEGATVYNWTAGSGTVTFPALFKTGTGSNLVYAGGGGGGKWAGVGGAGGAGGGGAGGTAGNDGTSGTDGTGGGGGGGSSPSPAASKSGGAGGSGIVVIRYAI